MTATTAERIARATLSPVALLRLTTYTNRAAETVDRQFHFSSPVGCRFQWPSAASAVNHHPLIAEIGSLDVGGPHLTTGTPQDLPSKSLAIELANLDFEGESLAKTLRGVTLENARVEVAQVLLEAQARVAFADLSSEDALVWYRGVVKRWGPISDTIRLSCAFEYPALEWLVSTEVAETDPRHVGRRYPFPIGEAVRVPAIGRKVGAVSTLAQKIDNTAGGSILLTDATGFPDSGSAYIASEKVTWTGKSGNTLSPVTRGASGTTIAFHTAGDAVVEVTDGATFTAAGLEVSSLGDVFVRNPFNGEIVRVVTNFTATPDDAATDLATTATINFSAADLEALVEELSQSAEAQDLPTGGVPSYTIDQGPQVDLCDSTDTGATARRTRWAPADGTAKTTRVDRGHHDVSSSNRWEGEFSSRSPFDRILTQQVRFRVRRTAGTGALRIQSSPAGASAPVTEQHNDASVTDGVVLIQTVKGAAGATDPKWWIDTGSGGTTWEVYEVWRSMDPDEIAGTDETDIAFSDVRTMDGDSSSSPRGTVQTELDDEDYGTGENLGSDPDSEWRLELTGGWKDALYRCEVTVGKGTSNTAPQATASRWTEGFYLAHCDFYANKSGGTDPSIYRNFFVSADEPGQDHGGGVYRHDTAGYAAAWATGANSKFTFWIDGSIPNGYGHDALVIRRNGSSTNSYVVEVNLFQVDPDPPVTPSVQVQAASVGYGLEIFVDESGPESPAGASPAYKAGTGGVVESPADVLRYLVEEIGGGEVDTDSYDDLHDAMQNPEQGGFWKSSTLSVTMNASTGTVQLSDNLDDDAHETGLVKIEDEWLTYTSMVGNTLNFAQRGIKGTTAAIHNSGVGVDIYPGPVQGITVAMNDSVLSVTVTSTAGYPDSGVLGIDDEEMVYSSKTATVFTLTERGANGTLATTHAVNDHCFEVVGSPVVFSGDLRPLGLTWREVVSRVAWECGANVIPSEENSGTVYRLLSANLDGDYPAAVSTIDEWEPGGFVELGRDIDGEIFTRGIFLYDFDPSAGFDDAAFKGALRASGVAAEHDLTSPAAAEIAAVEAVLGRLDADSPRPFYLVRDATGAGFIAGRDLSDRLRLPRLAAISGVPWFEGDAYRLEFGDVFNATPPWDTVSVPWRIVGYTKRFSDELVDLIAVEVPTT